jgi:hypothetical protein
VTPRPQTPLFQLGELLQPQICISPTPLENLELNDNLLYPQNFQQLVGPTVKLGNDHEFNALEEFNEGSDFFPSSPSELDLTTMELEKPSLQPPSTSSTIVFEHLVEKSMSEMQEPAAKKRKPSAPVSSAPTFFSSPLEYLLDMVSGKLSAQFLFKRGFFKRFETETAKDYNSFLEKVKYGTVSVDLKEFPAPILRNFFVGVAETFFHKRPEELPPLYCIVCGHADGKHDELVHAFFYSNLDGALVAMVQDRIMTVPELCKTFITFLLKHPDAHKELSRFISNNLFCPFCACKKGIHRDDRHQTWQIIFGLDPNVPPTSSVPEPSTNTCETVKATFAWLSGYVPVSIPPFLLSFHYIRNIQSFLDCLVTLWQSVRL